jgi:hypothetical protein
MSNAPARPAVPNGGVERDLPGDDDGEYGRPEGAAHLLHDSGRAAGVRNLVMRHSLKCPCHYCDGGLAEARAPDH